MRTWIVVVLVGAVAVAGASPPTKAQEANTRGMQLDQKHDYAHAADEFRAAIELDEKYVLAHYNLASMAARLGDKATLVAQLGWLCASSDPVAAAVLAQAKGDPDLRSFANDPDVRKLLEPSPASIASCNASCDATENKCSTGCGDSRGCMLVCAAKTQPCRDGCALGMTGDALQRMRAWLDGPLTGRDNNMANFRVATITRVDGTSDYTAYIKNQFGFMCALTWGSDGRPTKLSNCKSDEPEWTASPADIALRCTAETKPKQESCRGAFTLTNAGFDQQAEFLLRRAIK